MLAVCIGQVMLAIPRPCSTIETSPADELNLRNLFGEADRIAARASTVGTRRQYTAIYRAFAHWLREQLGRPPVVGDLDGDVIAAYARHLAASGGRGDQPADAETPEMREDGGLRRWRRSFNLRSVYETVGDFFDSRAVTRGVQRGGRPTARPPSEGHRRPLLPGHTPDELAIERKVARSTIYTQTAKAKRRFKHPAATRRVTLRHRSKC